MHIVYISREFPPSIRGGGIASYVKIMAEGFVSIGHQVTVITANDDTTKRLDTIQNGVRIIQLNGGDFIINGYEHNILKLKSFRFAYRYWSYRRKIIDEIKSLQDVDIIEVAEFGGEGLYLHELNIPVVYRLHTPSLLDHNKFSLVKINKSNLPYYYFGKIELSILRKHATHITSCSTSLRNWAIKYIGLPESSIKTIYNPLQPDFFCSRKILDENKYGVYVFYAGTICDWKGAEDLFDAMKILNSNRKSKIKLLMAGKTGAFSEKLKLKGADYDWFEILGKLPQDDLKTLYKNASAVCFPSWWENMPMVCIEAMSMGAIVIGSSSGGMSEIIEDKESGFLLPPKNPQIWANKIKSVLALSNSEKNEISKKAIMRIKNTFSLEHILDQTEKYFNCIILN